MTDAPWWLPLQELSDPSSRPPGRAIRPNPAPVSLGCMMSDVGRLFRASVALFWRVYPGREPKPVHVWTKEAGETCSSPLEADEVQARNRSETNRLLVLAANARKPLWVEDNPALPPEVRDAAGLHFQVRFGSRMFLPLAARRHAKAVLELRLPQRASHILSDDRERYLQAAYRLSQIWTHWDDMAAERRQSMGEPTSQIESSNATVQPLVGLYALREIFERQQVQTIRMLEEELAKLEGSKFSTLRQSQAFASELHQILETHALRVRCPHCGEAAILRCQASSQAPAGAFVFDHYLEHGRTFHGGRTALPRLYLLPKPPRKSIKVQIEVP